MARHQRARLPLAVALASTLVGLGAAAPAAHADAPKKPAKTAKPAKPAAKKKGAKVDCAKVKCIALTFDDGPGKYAGKLLDTLKKYDVKATFFLEGQYVKSRPAFAKRMAVEGHELGNHSYTHPNFREISDQEIVDELKSTHDAVVKATGKAPTMIRPPYGEFDSRTVSVAAEMGLPVVLWNGGSRDWATKNETAIYKEVLRNAKRDGVILMHDWVPATVTVMPKLLKELKRQGYHMVGVSSLLRNGKKLQPGEIYPQVKQEELESPPEDMQSPEDGT
ncbi:polysaccharide deacetylase family protein [Spongiactinospora sp. TRM90649]|uniref:polysaccharide deacetylase family protein n=1 Tax=Spongiactinospora sp. TRM90649 TaxID=3031114 RepID=UPI0023F72264|nr:polysaccharide deacetylase family protein [Spongiactinospora sp. TRM90649]MDF5751414.1 polysaccharide deacetylase family protein [Spongiactinospora sp. TRM90649]